MSTGKQRKKLRQEAGQLVEMMSSEDILSVFASLETGLLRLAFFAVLQDVLLKENQSPYQGDETRVFNKEKNSE